MRKTPNDTADSFRHPLPGEKHPLILIVEDHEDTRQLYNFVLTSHQYRVAEVGDGEIAVGMVERLAPDVILMDTSLPTLDGVAAAARIRASGRKDIPIIFISGNADPAFRRAALNAGGDDYLLKPIALTELEAAVARSLRRDANEPAARQVPQ